MEIFLIGIAVWFTMSFFNDGEVNVFYIAVITIFISSIFGLDDPIETINAKAKQSPAIIEEKVKQPMAPPSPVITKRDHIINYEYGANNLTPVIGWETRNDDRW